MIKRVRGVRRKRRVHPPSPLEGIEGVSLKGRDTGASPPSPFLTPCNKENLIDIFEERAAIYWFETEYSKEEAERMAFKDARGGFVENIFLDIKTAFIKYLAKEVS